MLRIIKISLVAVSSLLVMVQFQNCSKMQMSSIDPTQSKLGAFAVEQGGTEQLNGPVENQPSEPVANQPSEPVANQPSEPVANQPVDFVDCPELLINGTVEYIPAQTIEEMIASQPEGSRTDYLDGLLNSCKSTKKSDLLSNGSSQSIVSSGAAKCVKICHTQTGPAKKDKDDNSSDDNSSDDDSSDDNSSDDNSSDDSSSDDSSSDDSSSAD